MLHSPQVPTSKKCSRNRRRAAFGLLLLLSLLPQLAVAKARKPADDAAAAKKQDCLKIEECRQIFESARRLSDSRQYNAALTGYEKAYSMSTSPWLLINIGRVQQKLGRPTDAVTSFKRFLDDAEHQPAEAVSAAQEYLKQAESDLLAQREKEKLAAQPIATTAATDATAQKTEKPVYKKWWFWLALGGAAAAVATAVAVGVTVGNAGSSEPSRAPFHIAF